MMRLAYSEMSRSEVFGTRILVSDESETGPRPPKANRNDGSGSSVGRAALLTSNERHSNIIGDT